MNPEHLHVLINHLPIIGLAAALLPLVIGVIGKRRHESLFIGLVLTLMFAGSIPVVMWSGEEAEHKWLHERGGGELVGDIGMQWAHEHEERAELGSKVIYAAAGAALLALILFKPLPKWRRVSGTVVLLLVLASVGAGWWIADAGGQISHPEFREGLPPGEGPGEEPGPPHNHEHAAV